MTLSALSATTLSEGIAFLYSQAGDALKQWRKRREAAAATEQPTAPTEVQTPSAFDGEFAPLRIDFDALEQVSEPLQELRRDLVDYADGIESVDMRDERLLGAVDALRRLLEAVYQQRITFKGEQRPPSGPVEGHIDANEVAGDAAAVLAHVIRRGRISGQVSVGRVEPGGQLTGVDADTIDTIGTEEPRTTNKPPPI